MVFDLVNIANSQKVVDATKSRGKSELQGPEDSTGETTIEFMKKSKRLVSLIVGTDPSSLGLHPAVYFYSASGRHQPTAFLAVVSLMKELSERGRLPAFTKARRSFENFLIDHKDLANQITARIGSGAKGFNKLKLLFSTILDMVIATKSEQDILAAIKDDQNFYFLNFEEKAPPRGKKISTDVKSEVFLRQAFANPIRCQICDGLIGAKSITFDHITRKEDGGLGTVQNAQMAHPYCNSGFKEKNHHESKAMQRESDADSEADSDAEY